MAELLLELFSEEIPARMQVRAAEDLKKVSLYDESIIQIPERKELRERDHRRDAETAEGFRDGEDDLVFALRGRKMGNWI